MKPADDAKTPLDPAPAGRARIVFLRQREHFGRRPPPSSVRIADNDGQVVGDLSQDSWFGTDVLPGRHDFFSWHDDNAGSPYEAAICGEFAEGRVYYLAVVEKPHDWTQTAARFSWAVGAAPIGSEDGRYRALVPDPPQLQGARTSAADWIRDRVVLGRQMTALNECLHVHADDGKTVVSGSFW